jgi:tetratricopeptide (TPR) repeat protein
MQLSSESYRVRWFILVITWILAALFMVGHTLLVREYLKLETDLGARPVMAPTPLNQMYPAFGADAEVWVRHALALIEGQDVRLRYTTIDNAPLGREVHWNSAWAWAIAGAGWVHHLFTGDPIHTSVERATLWLPPLTLMVLIMVLSTWVTRRAGVIAGLLVAVALVCHDRIYEGFFPTYVDHHGLLTVAVFGTVLGMVFMGAGWWKAAEKPGRGTILPTSVDAARAGAVMSAISGAFGLWVSAASTIPPIAIVGFAGALAILLRGRTLGSAGIRFDPGAWRLWGQVGAAGSMAFYLIEYFPNHLSLRMEPNHPFYALAWLGAGELIAQLGERWLAAPAERWARLKQLIWPTLAVAIAPITIIIFGAKVFSPLDPFLSRLHNDYIQEFLPLWKTIRMFSPSSTFQIIGVGHLPLVLAIGALTYYRGKAPVILWFATIACFGFTALAWAQSRWLLNASGAQVTLLMVLLATWTVDRSLLVRWISALVLMGLLFIPNSVRRYVNSADDVKARRVSPPDANSPLFRDIAAVLRASQPQGDIVLLSSPNASTGIGYYGRFKTLGTLYWENNDGLKAAGAILGARTEAEAAKLIQQHKVTHIAIVSQENFIAQYYYLAHPNATAEELRKGFGHQLLLDKMVPQWLQMLPYKVPEKLGALNITVMLFKVNFNQSTAEAIYHVALAQIESGEIEAADKTLSVLTSQAPNNYQPWIRRGELALARRDWEQAAEFLTKGVALAPAAEKEGLYISGAHALYTQHQHAIAVRLYRTALAEKFSPDAACYLAWVLATSRDDTVRNGPEALTQAQAAVKADPNSPAYLNSLAAALVEVGRRDEGLAAMDKAIATARIRKEVQMEQASLQRSEIIKAGKPLRE